MFFALKGETFNGNAYAGAALEKGCACAVVDEAQYAVAGDERYILVDDVLTTLQQLARHHRRVLGTPIVGVTGTNGKTTTKELLAAVLSRKFNVLYTQGNFNNHIGVPKTLLQLRPEHEVAVVEMGANHPGEIRTLVNIAEPDCGLITNVGKAHLLGFGSFEGVIRTKGELYDFLREHEGLAFVNQNNPYLCGIAEGLQRKDYVSGCVTDCSPFLSFEWEGHAVQTQLIGAYNLDNALAAATVGRHFGVSDEDICTALSEYAPSNNRSQFTVTPHNHLVVDTYNANPTSMAAALDNFRQMKAEGKMCILGDMKELGEVSRDEHQRVVEQLKAMDDVADVWLVGEEFAATQRPDHFRVFADVEAVKAAIAADRPTQRTILIKGSNGTKLFQLPKEL